MKTDGCFFFRSKPLWSIFKLTLVAITVINEGYYAYESLAAVEPKIHAVVLAVVRTVASIGFLGVTFFEL